LGWLAYHARLLEQRQRWQEAEAARSEVLRRRTQLHGLADWRVTDARLDLEQSRGVAPLSAAPRGRLPEGQPLPAQGLPLWQAGRSREALPLAQRARELAKEVVGEKQPLYATSLGFVVMIYKETGEHKRALPLAKQALQIRKEALGKHHPDYAKSLNHLAA